MKTEDLEIEWINPGPKGGQHVGVPHFIIKVRHKPTGLVAMCSSERSQLKNRNVAISMIEWGLAEIGWKE